MLSHWGESKTFQFAVWHLPAAAQCGAADTSPDEVGKEKIRGIKMGKQDHQITASCGLHGPDRTLDRTFFSLNLRIHVIKVVDIRRTLFFGKYLSSLNTHCGFNTPNFS